MDLLLTVLTFNFNQPDSKWLSYLCVCRVVALGGDGARRLPGPLLQRLSVARLLLLLVRVAIVARVGQGEVSLSLASGEILHIAAKIYL